MCGRYTLTIDKSTIEHHFGSKFYITQPSYDWLPTFNAAPKGGASGQRNGSATRTHDRKIAPALRPRPTSRCSRHRSAAATASCSPTATMWRAVGKQTALPHHTIDDGHLLREQRNGASYASACEPPLNQCISSASRQLDWRWESWGDGRDGAGKICVFKCLEALHLCPLLLDHTACSSSHNIGHTQCGPAMPTSITNHHQMFLTSTIAVVTAALCQRYPLN
jgi:hypothetical protein